MIVGLYARHGENPANKLNIFRGRIDAPIDKEGEEQARDLADYVFENYTVERLVVSPLLRTMETAQPIKKAFGLEIIQEGALMATDTGFLTGEDKDEFNDVYEFFLENPSVTIPRGESMNTVHDRVGDFFEKDLKNSAFTLYMAHSSTGVVLANLVNGNRDLRPGVDHIIDPGGLCEIHFEDGSYVLRPVFKESKKVKEKETPVNV
jgi:broad specificity phosphatase PhoE